MEKSEKLKQVLEMFGKKKLSSVELFIFNEYWSNPQFGLEKDTSGNLFAIRL